MQTLSETGMESLFERAPNTYQIDKGRGIIVQVLRSRLPRLTNTSPPVESQPMTDTIDPKGMLLSGVPHAGAIGLHVVEINTSAARTSLAYNPDLVGNPDTGVLHGGVITAMLDNTCGMAVAAKSGMFGQIATLDLRIDYMKPATPGETVFAIAECYKVTKNIAFVRGAAYHTDRADPIATCTAAFMLGTKSQMGANLAQKEPG
jgi:uncharacterized protein (TIGR00369 family)